MLLCRRNENKTSMICIQSVTIRAAKTLAKHEPRLVAPAITRRLTWLRMRLSNEDSSATGAETRLRAPCETPRHSRELLCGRLADPRLECGKTRCVWLESRHVPSRKMFAVPRELDPLLGRLLRRILVGVPFTHRAPAAALISREAHLIGGPMFWALPGPVPRLLAVPART